MRKPVSKEVNGLKMTPQVFLWYTHTHSLIYSHMHIHHAEWPTGRQKEAGQDFLAEREEEINLGMGLECQRIQIGIRRYKIEER